jgi:GR25 family glycosyltransferase involved in LPS biosynthesis
MRFHWTTENVFCIHVSTSTVRQQQMEARLGRQGLPIVFWEATTPETLPKDEVFAPYLTQRQRSCAYSHLRVWRHMVANRMPYALILEDDILFDGEWRKKLDEWEPEQQWDMVLLNAADPVSPPFRWERATNQCLAGAYILSLQGAEWMLAVYQREWCASDWMTNQLQTRGRSYVYFPWLVIQEGLGTEVGSNYDADHKKVVRCLREIDYSLDHYS